MLLFPTPHDQLLDAQRRPTFLWDCDLTWEQLQERLVDPDPEVRAFWRGTVLRQAKPDDALTLIPAQEIVRDWDQLAPFLGQQRAFWLWLSRELVSRARP